MFSRSLEQNLSAVFENARAKRHRFVTLEHLLLALLDNAEARQLLEACGADIERLRTGLAIYIEENTIYLLPNEMVDIRPNLMFQLVMQHAIEEVKRSACEEVTGVHVLLAIFKEGESQAVYFLNQEKITYEDAMREHAGSKQDSSAGSSQDEEFQNLQSMQGFGGLHGPKEDEDFVQMAPAPQEENIVDLYTTNLNKKAECGMIDPLIGRSHELNRALQILCRRNKNNPLFVGEAGVGKTAVAEGVAQLIVDGKVPDAMKNCTVYSLDMGALLAGTKYRGDFEKRFKSILKALNKNTGAIIFIDEIHNLIGAGSATGGTLDASNLIKPLLSSGDLRCMGATTYEEFRKHFQKDGALSRRFQKVDIPEPTEQETANILRGIKGRYQAYHNLDYTDDALKRAAELSARYLPDRHMPDMAIDLIDEAGASQHTLPEKKRSEVITRELIDKTFAKMARIPIQDLQDSDKDKIANMNKHLNKLIFGQDHAIDKICDAIQLSRIGLGQKDKPIGSFLLVGPTGVGKTALMKAVSEEMGVEFLRFDMSEYMEKHSVSRLIGAPPGYVGYDEGGMLSEAVRKHPHCVLLLDEIEKAHSDIYNILLQVMDYGHLTDSNGQEIDFRHVVIAMTSNVGADMLETKAIGFVGEEKTDGVKDAVKRKFTPEFRNRLDDVVLFNYLEEKVIVKVVDKFMGELKKQLRDKKIKLTISAPAKKHLAKLGYDRYMGARPMARTIQEQVRLPIARVLLEQNNDQSVSEVKVGLQSGELTIDIVSKNEVISLG